MSGIREEFEEWYIREFFDGDKECAAAWMITDPVSGGYLMERPAQYLSVWQASRAALKVELPEKIGPHNMIGRHVLPEAAGYDDAIDDCREALQQAGIEVAK